MKLYHTDKNKGKSQFFINFTEKINDNDLLGLPFYKTTHSCKFNHVQTCPSWKAY